MSLTDSGAFVCDEVAKRFICPAGILLADGSQWLKFTIDWLCFIIE